MVRRPLSSADAELWAEVARTIRPLHGPAASPATPPAPPSPPPAPPVAASPPVVMPPLRIGALAAPPPMVPARVARPPLALDAAVQRDLMRGRLTPQARLDLHGFTLAEAHPELVRFVLRAHGAEQRLLLVITGKGRERATDPMPGGLLRQQVPRWLTLQPVAPVVLHQTTAHQRHGGAGALYVYLRRRR